MDIEATGEWKRPFDIMEDEFEDSEFLSGTPVSRKLVCQGTPDTEWVPTMLEGASEIIRLRAVIERIQKNAYDGDMVFVICRDELGHE